MNGFIHAKPSDLVCIAPHNQIYLPGNASCLILLSITMLSCVVYISFGLKLLPPMGNLLAISVHAANIHDTKSGINPAKKAFEKYPTIQRFCGDDGYRKSFEEAVLEQLGLGVDISKRLKPEFEVFIFSPPSGWIFVNRLDNTHDIGASTPSHIRIIPGQTVANPHCKMGDPAPGKQPSV